MWGRGAAGSARLPVTQKVAGSNPVDPAKFTELGKFGKVSFRKRERFGRFCVIFGVKLKKIYFKIYFFIGLSVLI